MKVDKREVSWLLGVPGEVYRSRRGGKTGPATIIILVSSYIRTSNRAGRAGGLSLSLDLCQYLSVLASSLAFRAVPNFRHIYGGD